MKKAALLMRPFLNVMFIPVICRNGITPFCPDRKGGVVSDDKTRKIGLIKL